MLREYMKFHEFNDTRSLISNRDMNVIIENVINLSKQRSNTYFHLKRKKKKKEEEEKIECTHICDVSRYKWRDINTSEIKLK